MRSDMAKVLVERPRGGYRCAGKGYLKDLQRTPIEEMRSREGIKARARGNRKWFNDHLGPLRRFLLSNVGRPWDVVYSEICRGLARGFRSASISSSTSISTSRRRWSLIDGVPCRGDGPSTAPR